jgi:hypothetical protein
MTTTTSRRFEGFADEDDEMPIMDDLPPSPPPVFEVAPAPPKKQSAAKKRKPPAHGRWEVQTRGNKGRWAWLESVAGPQPDKSHVRDAHGPGSYRITEEGGYSELFEIAYSRAQEQEVEPEPQQENTAALIRDAVTEAIQAAMGSIVPLLSNIEPRESPDMQRIAATLDAMSRQIAAPPTVQQQPEWQTEMFNRVISHALDTMGIRDEEEEEEKDTATTLIETIGKVAGAFAPAAGVGPPPGMPPMPLGAPQPHPGTPHPSEPVHGVIQGMTPEIEAELRAVAAQLGYDFSEAIAAAAANGIEAPALLELARGMLEEDKAEEK